jgi:tRNA(fMet)-specific endonuclease VapC
VTLAELSVGPLVAKRESERVARQTQLQQAEADFKPLPFDADAARAFGSVAASLRRASRKATARTYDAMIAATAVANDLPIYTCNPTDFNGIDGLEVVTVPVPGDPPAPSASEQAAHETAHDPENPQQPD